MALPDGAIARLKSGGRQHAAKRVDGRAKAVIGRGAEADHHAVRIGDVRTGQWMAQPSQPGERHPGLAGPVQHIGFSALGQCQQQV
ncbi:Uncharacterised protein [Mycobacteroides abscessus subsp. bolletii]|nr:Uncharacterised protein [Mycobacteroides abscessus subsp. bolletii]SHT23146.1 Uncharacterised protein [Mycobacteroides abscessus subsp. bolletii]SHT62624.1 Uncharacterised protein [Mycobacteroides abscessus subsp. bolletii]SKH01330.1 Uncharacterised protein [Mycobacteroides abscessus subsp. bolletii]SKH11430.1 Uncharacterised protein [Mycobacteroides abscessus subsp. bolletii]